MLSPTLRRNAFLRPFTSAIAAVLALAASAANAGAQAPLRLFVDAQLGTGANDGSSWSNAFQGPLGLQQALAAIPMSTPAEVWIADGTYRPGPPSAGSGASFVLRDGVALYGGFAGGETSLAERDPIANPARLSGDLASNDVPFTVFGVQHWQNASENSLHVVRAVDVGASARLDGLVIRRGSALGSLASSDGSGAGLDVANAALIVQSCTFEHCFATTGGGVRARGGTPLFVDCAFERNHANAIGAGAWIDADTQARFERCTWHANVGSRGVGLWVGPFFPAAAIGATRAEAVDCVFEANTGPISSPSGMGIHVAASHLDVVRTLFLENHSGGGGGGVYVDGSDATFRNCDFVRNSGAFDGGGALYVDGNDAPLARARCIDSRFVGNNGVALCVQGELELTNCTLHANDETFGQFVAWPILVATANGSAHLQNCIVQNHPGSLVEQFALSQPSSVRIDDSCVAGWDGSLPGSGNIALAAQFVDANGADGSAGTLDDDLGLLASSPCIDRSNHAWRTLSSDLDALGAPRFVERLDVADLGSGCAPLADLGALERGPDGPWTDLGGGIAGGACVPHLALAGTLTPAASMLARSTGALPLTPGFLVLGLHAIDLPLLGATLVPEPLFVRPWATSAAGVATFAFHWPADIAGGATLYAQSWHLDAGALQGWAASNAQLGSAP